MLFEDHFAEIAKANHIGEINRKYKLAGSPSFNYLWALYMIEGLRHFNPNVVTTQIAWQYGQDHLTAWRNNLDLVDQYRQTHFLELRHYVYYRGLKVVKKLIKMLPYFQSDMFTNLPVDAQTMQTIITALQEFAPESLVKDSASDKLGKDFFEMYRMSSDEIPHTTKYENSIFTQINMVDRILCGIFDTQQLEKPNEEYYNPEYNKQSSFASGLKKNVAICQHVLGQLVGTQETLQLNNDGLFNNFVFWASILSILYRSRVPLYGFSNFGSLDTLYSDFFFHRGSGDKDIQDGRLVSGEPLEDIFACCAVNLNYELLTSKTLDRKYSMNAVYPHSLVERIRTLQLRRKSYESEPNGEIGEAQEPSEVIDVVAEDE